MNIPKSLPFRASKICLRLLFLTSLCGFIACAVGGGDDDDGGSGGGGGGGGPTIPQDEKNFSIGLTTDSGGRATTSFQVALGSTKFGVSAIVNSSEQVRFTRIMSSSGVNLLNPNGLELSFADSLSPGINSASVPSRADDPNVVANESYTVEVFVADDSGAAKSGADVTLIVNSDSDANLNTGNLNVNIFYVGDVGQEEGTKQVVSQALNEFRTIFSRQAGINLNVNEFDISGPVVLPQPFTGSDIYQSASSMTTGLGVNIFIAGDIDGGGGQILGLAGGIIAPPIPSRRSALAVGVFAGAGPNGTFDATEIRLLGETMAHESGHYMGLFHPVDFSGEVASATDPLDDTFACGVFAECLADESSIRNLMFTTVVSDGSGGFVPQNELSDQQRSVLNRYIAVD